MSLNRNGARIQFPYFIGLFIIAMLASSYFTDYQLVYTHIIFASKKLLVLTMFLIGAGLNIDSIRSVGIKPFIQGVSLWFFISGLSLLALLAPR
jgi:uncharacterized membrane protein YadS